jgi:hypothetical protein
MKKQQQKIKKARPRGRPFPPGVSGNLRGRPPGARNKLSLMVEEGIRRAKEELAKPLILNQVLPYESWGDRYVQSGRLFRKDTLEELNPGAPPLEQPELLNHRKPRIEIRWKRKDYFIQDGWLYDRATWEAVKLNGK